MSAIISIAEYTSWTTNWLDKLKNDAGSFPFFMHGNQIQTGAVFDFDDAQYLFSTPGVVTIKVRFGLRQSNDGSSWEFQLILFGVDNLDNMTTPYYTTSPFALQLAGTEEKDEGNLPQVFMEQWRENWRVAVSGGSVGRQLFMLEWEEGDNKYLRGYNYPLKEIMQAMLAFTGKSDIHLKFGLHKYYSMYQPVTPPVLIQTFGLILYAGVRTEGSPTTVLGTIEGFLGGNKEEIIEESGFYDFSAPCPHTC